MKIKLIVFLIVIIVSLSAQISDPIEINENYHHKKSGGQRAYQIVNGVVYMTYQQHFIFFSKVIDSNTQTHTIIDTMSNNYNSFIEPVIQVLENGDIIIVYLEKEDYDSGYLKIATSTDDGESFSVEAFEITDFGNPHIVQSDDGLDICFSNNLQEKSLAEFQHFTEYEKSENEDGGLAAAQVKFFGMDEYFGHVHSNDDIWIQNSGGWPIFHGLVTTAGRIMDFDTHQPAIYTAPMAQIFLSGWEEEIESYEQIGLEELQANSILLGDPDTDIVYVKLCNSSFVSMFGQIEETGTQQFEVYSWFPQTAEEANTVVNNGGNWYDDSDHVWTNEVTLYDTVWTVGPNFPVIDQSVWVDCELWIEGEVLGTQTWASSDTIYIVGDITYANTSPGTPPDEVGNLNLTDYFGLVSAERIFIRYKHKDPFEEMAIRDDNCANILLYGAYAALGVGDTLIYGEMACHYDGIFTPQYQHPHGSIPDFTALSPYTLQETLYTYVDLHKYVFPQSNMLPPELEGFNLHGGQPVVNQTCGFPYESPAYINSYPNNDPGNYVYPYGTDYPWYNPVWPESSEDIVFERGNITIFGSIAQTRRGYIHRSGGDPYNHPGDNEWDMDEYHYDGFHGSTGYDKDYHYDFRLNSVQPPNFPRVIQAPDVSRNINVLHSSNNGQNFSESYVEDVGEMLQALWMDSDGESVLIAYQTANDLSQFHFLISDDDPQDYEYYVVNSEGSKLKNAHILGDEIYVLSELDFYDQIYCYQIGNPIPELIQSFDPGFHLSDFSVGESGALAYVHVTYFSPDDLHLDFRYNNESGTMAGIVNWTYPFEDIFYYGSEISIQLDENNTAYSTILVHTIDINNMQYSRQLYLISGELEGIVKIDENEIIPPKISMQIYPNPFNPETTISFSLTTESTENTEINIYNVRGQKVKSISAPCHPERSRRTENGTYSITWNGKDINGKSVASGIYLFELKSDGKVQKTKKGLLLK
ncbi:MAG: T9SS type A sorting domain-containing protein [Candidatus Cloacimonetes bacterium]|nr:T9SS type A sorting domain-containing protein [Candidatus Cloacimonadota bacterium]